MVEGKNFIEEKQAGVGTPSSSFAFMGSRSIWRTAS
jgi:hypothetical protein